LRGASAIGGTVAGVNARDVSTLATRALVSATIAAALSVAGCGIVPLPPSEDAHCAYALSEMTENDPAVTLVGTFDTTVGGLLRLNAAVAGRQANPRVPSLVFPGHGPNDPAILCFFDIPNDPASGERLATGWPTSDNFRVDVAIGSHEEVPVAAP
jgi:hypothetical protein